MLCRFLPACFRVLVYSNLFFSSRLCFTCGGGPFTSVTSLKFCSSLFLATGEISLKFSSSLYGATGVTSLKFCSSLYGATGATSLRFCSGLYGVTGVTLLKFCSSFLWSDWGDLAQILF